MSMVQNFKQVGRAGWALRHGTGAEPRERTLTQCLPFTQGSVGGTEKGKETLRSFVTDATARAAGKALSLVIVDQEKRFRFELVLKT